LPGVLAEQAFDQRPRRIGSGKERGEQGVNPYAAETVWTISLCRESVHSCVRQSGDAAAYDAVFAPRFDLSCVVAATCGERFVRLVPFVVGDSDQIEKCWQRKIHQKTKLREALIKGTSMNSELVLRLFASFTIRQVLKRSKLPKVRIWTAAALALTFGTPAVGQPVDNTVQIENACEMMQQRPAWYSSAAATAQKWQVPLSSILAIIRQESRFVATAAARQSSAYGFAQALDGTWNAYRRATKAYHAKRISFADSVDFVAWYITETRKRTGLHPEDTASHYLAYHEGHAGFRSNGWMKKPHLIRVAHKVAETASTYRQHLESCVITLPVAQAIDVSPLPGRKPFALSEVTARMPKPKPTDRYVAALSSARGARLVPARVH